MAARIADVLVVVSCVYAAIVSTQVKSLKTEIATLQREIIALKLHVTRLDQIASANEARNKPGSETPKPPAESRPEQASLNLSRKENRAGQRLYQASPGCGLRRADQGRRSRHGRDQPLSFSDHG